MDDRHEVRCSSCGESAPREAYACRSCGSPLPAFSLTPSGFPTQAPAPSDAADVLWPPSIEVGNWADGEESPVDAGGASGADRETARNDTSAVPPPPLDPPTPLSPGTPKFDLPTEFDVPTRLEPPTPPPPVPAPPAAAQDAAGHYQPPTMPAGEPWPGFAVPPSPYAEAPTPAPYTEPPAPSPYAEPPSPAAFAAPAQGAPPADVHVESAPPAGIPWTAPAMYHQEANPGHGEPDQPISPAASPMAPTVVGRAMVRASAPVDREEIAPFRSEGTTYRAGDSGGMAPPPASSPPVSPAPPAPLSPAAPFSPPASPVLNEPDEQLPTRIPGQFSPQTAEEAPWAAFTQPEREADPYPEIAPESPPPAGLNEPSAPLVPRPRTSIDQFAFRSAAAPISPVPTSPAAAVAPDAGGPPARASAAVAPGSRLTAAEFASAAQVGAVPTPRLYRAGQPDQPRPAEPPQPAEPPKPAEPPRPAEPPQPAEPPPPPPPGPEPSPFPAPFPGPPAPGPAPRPQPEPYPAPEPGPPYPPRPPAPPGPPQPPSPMPGPSPVPPPPGPSPIPPYPPPPPAATGTPGAAPAARTSYPPNDWRSTLMPPEPARPEPANGGPAQPQRWAPLGPGSGGVYSGPANGPSQTGQPIHGFENSGSLTGHILGQGHPDAAAPKSRMKVVLVLLLVVGVLVAAGVAAVAFGGDMVGQLFGGLFTG